MDLSAIIVVIVLTALAIGAIVGLEIYSRKAQRNVARKDASNLKRINDSRFVI